MRIPIKRDGKLKWIVLERSLIAGDEEIARFVKEEITSLRLAQESGIERIIKEAQERGIVAYMQEER
ncbi:hypothetical protein [Helicobacter cholecystus]|uniref:hypothetical protein n=1 Tax=Helicobacter cholecystus TaxID=45498 RepID=UPI00273A1C6B|nr:hypothetical protein [Helicobacter cholecystus]